MSTLARNSVAADVREVFRREPDTRYDPDTCAERVQQLREARGEHQSIKMETVLRAFYRNRRKR